MTVPALSACPNKNPSLISLMKNVEFYSIPQRMINTKIHFEDTKHLVGIKELTVVCCLHPRQYAPDKVAIMTRPRRLLDMLR
jgi:hypothetical protein